MNTTKTKSYFSPRLAKIVVLIALLVCSLPSIGNDGRDPRHIQYVYGLYIFRHDTPTWDGASHFTVTYKDTTYNTYSGDIFIPYHNNNYLIDEIGDCAFKDCEGLTTIDMGFLNKVLRIDSCSFQNCTSLDSVTMSYCLNYIGDRAFQNCTHLRAITFSSSTSISYPSRITHVGDGAFQNCYLLPSLSLPNLEYIGSRAFRNCWAFKSFFIPAGVTSVGEAAFKGCHSLDTVYIQGCDNLPLGKNAFAECESLKAIICTSLIPPVVDQDLGLTPEQKATVKVIVPKMALEAYRKAPYWKDMAGLRTRSYDFEVMYRNKPMYFNFIGGDEVCITYKDTTYNSYDGNYVEDEVDMFDYNGHVEHWRGMSVPDEVTFNGKTYYVTAIGENAFRGCTSLNKLDWFNRYRLTHIGSNAFMGCSNLKSVDLPQRIETIGAHAFEGCSKIPVIGFPSTVNIIDTCAFMGCSRMKYVKLESAMQIGPKAFSGTNLRGHTLTGGIAIECSSATPPVLADSTVFDSTHYANSVVKVLYSLGGMFRADENWNRFVNIRRLPYDFKDKDNNNNDIWYRINNENEVGVSPDNEVLYGTYGYGARDIPETVNYQGHSYRVTSIESRAFYFSEPEKITIPNSVKRIGDLAFGRSFVEQVILGDSVETIGMGAFNETSLKKINIPKSVKEIGDSALFNTPDLYQITVEEGNPVYDSREDCNALIETATNRLIAGARNCTEIPSSVTSITDYAFYGKRGLNHITIPGSISRIGGGAFAGCFDLSQVSLSEPTKCIGPVAFTFSGLTSVVIPNSVDTIGEGAFSVCDKLKIVTLGTGLKYLGEQAFGKGYNGTMVIDTVFCYATTPPKMASANCFSGVYDRAVLLVPQASLELYKNDPNWSQFYKIVAIESSGIDEIPVDDGAPSERYNLQGQPVGDDYRGIVIENGRKILKP